MRQEADYAEMSELDAQDASEAIAGAKDFIAQVKHQLKSE